jgi:sulfite reductase (ferredoxin)
MKFLFLNHGWTRESFLAEVERRIGYTLDPAAPEQPPEGAYRDHVGVGRQREDGVYFAGFSVVSGRITPEQLRHIAALADRFGDGTLRLSATQNIIVLNVQERSLDALREASAAIGIPLSGSPFQRGTLSCTGSEYCKLAITETKMFSIRLAHELEERLPGFTESIKLNVTGCPNACGQHWIADVGLQGVLVPGRDAQVEGFDFFVGGGLGAASGVARRVGYRAPADDVPDALERLFRAFDATHQRDESFRQWAARYGDAGVKRALAEGAAA